MVSFWPWKGDDSSPASFEKSLSILSTKITATQAQLDRLRTNSRRIKVLWTLYLTFGYLVYAIVLTLVVGWQNLGTWEWTGMAGGPVLIYLIRTSTNAYFNFRIDSLENRMKDQQAEREKTIQKLKDATKYDSTLELLEKYGGTGEKRTKGKKQGEGDDAGHGEQKKGAGKKGRQSIGSHGPGGRTNLPPPPTANIQRPPSAPGIPQNQQGGYPRPPLQAPSSQHLSAEFAPNAGPLPPMNAQYDMNPGPPRWYDRIMDLMLGEDETVPKNRIILICDKCRLVNGQAPPGIKNLSELGTWKCMACGAVNGEVDEGKKIMREVLGNREGLRAESSERDSDRSSDLVKVGQDDEDTDGEEEHQPLMEERKPNLRNKKSQMVP